MYSGYYGKQIAHLLRNGSLVDDSNPKPTIIKSDLNVSDYNFIDIPRKFRLGGGTEEFNQYQYQHYLYLN